VTHIESVVVPEGVEDKDLEAAVDADADSVTLAVIEPEPVDEIVGDADCVCVLDRVKLVVAHADDVLLGDAETDGDEDADVVTAEDGV
jgi:hypothetical protein